MATLTLIFTVLVGLLLLLAGRQLFWLTVALLGFAFGAELATNVLAGQPEWLILVVAIGIGLLGALLGVFLQYVAVGLAGFLGGAYLVLLLWRTAGLGGPEWLSWVAAIVAGIIGAILVLMLLDYALIVLTSLVGAGMLVPLLNLELLWQTILFVVLAVIGIAFQSYLLSRDTAPRRRVIIRRRSTAG